MSFFESVPLSPPPPESPRRPQPVWMRPDAVIPGSVAADVLLIRTESVALAISDLRSYPNGFEFTVHVRFRDSDESMYVWHDPFGRQGRGREGADDSLRLGILYPDGRRDATTTGYEARLDDEADTGRLVLNQQGSSSSDRRWDGDFWVHPLPPDGPVKFVASWREHGVSETWAELDGSAILAAADRAVILWD